ncbi:MAG: hypothetical protein JSS20_04045 [Proteobacteria bacterium]|nr:hypothetical protein [Pseudomonadota bacterium]
MPVVDPKHWLLDAADSPRAPAFTTGNAVTALIDGAAYMRDLKQTLATCDRQLLIAGWEFEVEQRLDPSMTNDVLSGSTVGEAITDAARRGADVRALIFDVPTSSLPSHFRELHAPANVAFAEAVNAAGGDAILDSRLAHTPTLSSHHQKLIVSVAHDPLATAAYVGGIDLGIDRWDTPAHVSPPERQHTSLAAWHDIQARIQGPAVVQLWQAFRSRWNDPRPPSHLPALERFRGRSRMEGDPPACPAQAGSLAVQVRQTLPAGVFPEPGGSGEATIALGHALAIDRAEHLIYIEDQYVWPCTLIDNLEDALHRGVHVVMVVAREDMRRAARRITSRLRYDAVSRLEKAGGSRFQIFHLEQPFGEREQIYVHSKLMIVDDCFVSIGSANLNGRSLTNDTEIEIGIVDEERLDITIGGKPARVTRFANELRCRLWSEHFGRPAQDFADPIASLPLLWTEAAAGTRHAEPHQVRLGILDLEPVSEMLTSLISEHLIDVPMIDLPSGPRERNAVKLLVNSALHGPSRTILMKALEESFNPDLAPTLNKLGNPLTSAWRRHWARRAAHAAGLIGKRTRVTSADLVGQEFVESSKGVQIFRLADGRYHVVSHFAVPSLETARAAAIAISGEDT